jgi:hypothetical protein
LNGCSLWDQLKPENEIEFKLKRPCTPKEIQDFDELIRRFKLKTERERFIVQREYANNNKNSNVFSLPMYDIFR